MRRTVAEHKNAVLEVLALAWQGRDAATFVPGSGLANDAGTLLPLTEALGRVLAEDLVAPIDLPPFANSQMDGFAIWIGPTSAKTDVADSSEPTTFLTADTIPAGAIPVELQPHTAAPIMTGAMLPQGANAVVPVEKAVPAHFPAVGEKVALPATTAGTFVRAQGSDMAKGSRAIAAGTLLNAAHIGLASALGCTQLLVRRAARVLLLTTGDEVLLPGDPRAAQALPEGKIYDANMALLRANFTQAGLDVVVAPVVEDEPHALLHTLDRYLGHGTESADSVTDGTAEEITPEGIDLIVSTGGISAGAFEVVKQAMAATATVIAIATATGGPGAAENRVDVEFFSVALQPGGPQALGTYKGVPFIGFPGNPVSGVVSFEMFLRPTLTSLLGAPTPRAQVLASLEGPLSSPLGKYQIRRGIYQGPGFESAASVREVGGPSSHLLGALAQANALIHIPAGVTQLRAGAKVEVWLL